ncbi:MAG: nucleoside triphosphate pyrophosphohydrolase [Flavobacteriaceae bacterium]|nr:nucleoside triphosphate pyrophosphohydrolase [Flavobacteriaceae bacterium]
MSSKAIQLEAIERLLVIMDELREQCPWDRKQTFESLRSLTIEETYELAEAIIEGNQEEIKKELGDLLLHIVFYAKIGSETNDFDLADIAHSIAEKLIQRHPHIYGDVTVSGAEDVKKNWEALKLKEGNKSVLSGVPKGLPSLIKAMRIQEKAAGVGFDWENRKQVWDKCEEELDELNEALKKKDKKAIESEMGDVLFSLVNYARFIGVDPSNALEKTNQKFIKRFSYIENEAKRIEKNINDLSLGEMEKYWQAAKKS